MAGYVFVSYSSDSDHAYVEALAAHLSCSGVRCWFDRRLKYGQVWTKAIKEKIDGCSAVLVVMTPESERSEWVDLEIAYARKNGKPIIPLLLRGEPFFTLGTAHYHDARGGRMPSVALVELLKAQTAAPASGHPRAAGCAEMVAADPDGGAGTDPDSGSWAAETTHERLHTYGRRRPVFVQYLNPEIRACYGLTAEHGYVDRNLGDALHATRLALLATDDSLVFPASYFREVHDMPLFLALTEPLVKLGRLQYTSNTDSLSEYFRGKRTEYRADSRNPYATSATLERSGIRWRPRRSASTAAKISNDWHVSLRSANGLGGTVTTLHARWPARRRDVVDVLDDVPERLDGQAFVPRFVEPLIPVDLRSEERKQIAMFISRSYLVSYLEDLDANLLADFGFADLSCWVGRSSRALSGRVLSARRFDAGLAWIGLDHFVHQRATWDDLVALSAAPEFGAVAVAIHHTCPVEPFRRVAVRLRRSRPIDPMKINSLREALEISSMVAAELQRLAHPGI